VRIGLLGGTFDPPHIGHLLAALGVGEALHLDTVLLMVANDPWQKREQMPTPAAVRLEMTRAAVEGIAGIEVSDLEIQRGGATYTIDTVEALSSQVVVIAGSDAAARIDSWHRAGDLAAAATIAVVNRPGTPMPLLDPRWRVHHVDLPQMDVSSTRLRERVAASRTTQVLLPEPVRRIVDRHGLYRLGP